MSKRPDLAAIPGKRWIDWTAQRISDPVERLRFLRTVAPVWQLRPRRRFLPAPEAALSLVLLLTMLTVNHFAVVRVSPKTDSHRKPAPAMAPNPIVPSVAVTLPAGLALPKAESTPEIWQVEKTSAAETYSNGLRIDNKFNTANHPRSYLAFAAAPGSSLGEARTMPAGIVYHTTESLQLPFEPQQNRGLQVVGEDLLGYVKQKKAYNFVIDRFGRVFRVVQESDAAEHAGYSVWSDENWLYVNLNESFIGVSLETQTHPGQVDVAVTAAQIRAAAMLTEMLRGRYKIPAGNCVTHAQVSVNPDRMLAGYHMDWASSFPFEQIGLPDNYARPLPSVAAFGFEYDASYSRSAGVRLTEGARLGAQQLAARAAAAGVGASVYRNELQKQYWKRLAATRHGDVTHEGD